MIKRIKDYLTVTAKDKNLKMASWWSCNKIFKFPKHKILNTLAPDVH